MCRDGPRRKGSANAELGDLATNGNYSVKPIQRSATVCRYRARRGTRVPIRLELGEERVCQYGARQGTRVPIRLELGEERECRYRARLHFYAIPILHFEFPKFFIYLYIYMCEAHWPLATTFTNGNYSVKPIQRSATVCRYRARRGTRVPIRLELGEERVCQYGARQGTRVPIQSSARNESADTAGARRGTRVPIQSSASFLCNPYITLRIS